MKKLLWIFIIIIALLLCFVIAKLTVFYDNDPKPDETPMESAVPAAFETSDIPKDGLTPEDPQALPETPPPMTEEEYDKMIQEEIEEVQQEDPLIDEHGEEVPTLDVSDEEEIIIDDTEAAGSL